MNRSTLLSRSRWFSLPALFVLFALGVTLRLASADASTLECAALDPPSLPSRDANLQQQADDPPELATHFPLLLRHGSPRAAEPSISPSFAPYLETPVDIVPNAPAYRPDLARVNDGRMFATRLTAEQRAHLLQNGFVVVPSSWTYFFDIYHENFRQGAPSYVSSDVMLHAYHMIYDGALQTVETDQLLPRLDALSRWMIQRTEAQLAAAEGKLAEAALENLAYFHVAARLLDPEADTPAMLRAVVEAELALIAAHEGPAPSPIFGYESDYSHFAVRGHYTRSPELGRYFRAMMWYGRMGFHLNFRVNEDEDPDFVRRQTRSALLLTRALEHEEARRLWDEIYDVSAFFVGVADDLTPDDYASLAEEVFDGPPDDRALADDARVEAFIEAARRLQKPAIMSDPIEAHQEPEITQGLRLMGQRYLPDSDIFQQLVVDRVSQPYSGEGSAFTAVMGQRAFPRGLDIPAALGSARALAILEAENDTSYGAPGVEGSYASQLAAVRAQFERLPGERWTSNLYWSWLHGLAPLLEPRGGGFPYFMQNEAWADRRLYTWLASWTELRHDTLLYAKQSASVPVSAPRPSDLGYVEADPWLWARLAAGAGQLRSGLLSRGMLDDRTAARLDRFEGLAFDFKTMSEQELTGVPLGAAQLERIKGFAHQIAAFETTGDDGDMEPVSLVTDVHSVYGPVNQVLQEAVGEVFTIYVIVPDPSDPRGDEQVVLRGGVFSHYEFKWPIDDRLSDEAWRRIRHDERPPLPAWTSSFIVGP